MELSTKKARSEMLVEARHKMDDHLSHPTLRSFLAQFFSVSRAFVTNEDKISQASLVTYFTHTNTHKKKATRATTRANEDILQEFCISLHSCLVLLRWS